MIVLETMKHLVETEFGVGGHRNCLSQEGSFLGVKIIDELRKIGWTGVGIEPRLRYERIPKPAAAWRLSKPQQH